MYHILPESDGSTIGICFQEWVSLEDLKTLFPFLENAICENRSIRVMLDLRYANGADFLTLIKVGSFLVKYGSAFEKKAVVSDNQRINNFLKSTRYASSGEIRCFSSCKSEEAWEWIKK